MRVTWHVCKLVQDATFSMTFLVKDLLAIKLGGGGGGGGGAGLMWPRHHKFASYGHVLSPPYRYTMTGCHM